MKSRAFVQLLACVAVQIGGCAVAEEGPIVARPDARVAKAASAPAHGEALYAAHCLSCHQADGGGVPNMQPGILDSSWVLGDPKALALFVMTGGFNSAERKESAVDNVMPAFRHLTDDDLAEILSFVRSRFGKGAGVVTPANVAEARLSLPAP
jgi:mono/diheme cytochrome c family protein